MRVVQVKDFETKGYDRYGASMGRRSERHLNIAEKVSLCRVPINSGGYDPGGAYWGTGEPLWCATDGNGDTKYFRAPSRTVAKSQLGQWFPNIRFFR